MVRSRWLSSIAMAVVLTSVSAAKGDECADVHAVLDAMPNGFRAIRGPLAPNERWRVTRSVAGYKECYLIRGRDQGMLYSCESVPEASQAAAQALLAKKVSNLKECLDPDFRFPTEWPSTFFVENATSLASLNTLATVDPSSGEEVWSVQYTVSPLAPATPATPEPKLPRRLGSSTTQPSKIRPSAELGHPAASVRNPGLAYSPQFSNPVR